MDKPTTYMDDPIITGLSTYREEQFRAPSRAEERLGLWVDRIGKATTSSRPERLRILGQYSHIHVLDGAGVYVSEHAGRLEVQAGDCMVQHPEDPCLYYPHERWTTCWVTWNGPESLLLRELGYVNPDRLVFPDMGNAVLEAHATLLPIIHNEDRNAVLQRKAVVLDMLTKCDSASQLSHGAPPRHNTMKRAVAMIHELYAEDLRVPELAATFHLSEPHFRRLFREYTGRSLIQFVRSLRIAQSKRLLLEGMPIKQVADTVGYRDVFYFMRIFKKETGIPPGQFQTNGPHG